MLNLRGWAGEGITRKICFKFNVGLLDDDCYRVDPAANWRNHPVRIEEIAARAQAFLAIPGTHLPTFKPVWMHTCCLGVLQYTIGNTMIELFYELGGKITSPVPACARLENMIKVCAQANSWPVPFHSLTIGMIKVSGKKPKMRLKATEGRLTLPIVIQLLKHYFPCVSGHAQLRLNCCIALRDCYDEFKIWDEQSPWKLGTYTRRFLTLYRRLDLSTPINQWHMYPKHHLLIHIAEDSLSNPAKEWNYGDESEIGVAVRITKTMNPPVVPTELLERYCDTFDIVSVAGHQG